MFPIDHIKAMPFNDEQAVKNGIHNTLADDQGIIEVKSGMTQQNHKYIYSIVKTKLNPSGVQYTLSMHIDFVSEVLKDY